MNATMLERRIHALETRLRPPTMLPAVEVARRSGIEPDAWQAGVLTSEARQIILLCSRQSGKSTVTAIIATHRAVTVPGSLVLLLAPALRQSQELFRKVKNVYAALGPIVPAVVENALSLELSNRSRVVCLPGKEQTVRGFSAPDLVIEDESARVPDDLHQAIRPMLAVSRGRLILLSSPFGKRGHFYDAWANGEAWERVRVTAHDVPRISAEWLAQERAAIGEWWFSQEYLCEFVEAEDAAFSPEAIARAFSAGVAPLFDISEEAIA